MQERVVEREAERTGPSWYLTRDGEQHGPLTDRELSLFAEGGNFKPGDLLWTAGLDGWKPANAVFGLKSSPEAERQEPGAPSGEASEGVFSLPPSEETDAEAGAKDSIEADGEDLDALVQALNGSAPAPKPTLKQRALAEIKTFVGIFLYLWVVFMVLLLHQWIVLSENHIGFRFYGLAAINALVLGKIMVIGEHFRFAEHLNQKPLIYPIVYKSVAFTTLLFIAYILEEMLVGWLRGSGFLASVPRLGGGLVAALSFWLIFCVALLPYFAFKEVERAVGPAAFRKLLLRRG